MEIKKIGKMQVLDIFSEKYRDDLPSGHEKEVVATFSINWNALSAEAKQTAQCIALLTAAPVRLIRDILGLKEKTGLKDPLPDSISELVRLSIVDLDLDNDPSMHNLLSAFIRSTLDTKSTLSSSVFEHRLSAKVFGVDIFSIVENTKLEDQTKLNR